MLCLNTSTSRGLQVTTFFFYLYALSNTVLASPIVVDATPGFYDLLPSDFNFSSLVGNGSLAELDAAIPATGSPIENYRKQVVPGSSPLREISAWMNIISTLSEEAKLDISSFITEGQSVSIPPFTDTKVSIQVVQGQRIPLFFALLGLGDALNYIMKKSAVEIQLKIFDRDNYLGSVQIQNIGSAKANLESIDLSTNMTTMDNNPVPSTSSITTRTEPFEISAKFDYLMPADTTTVSLKGVFLSAASIVSTAAVGLGPNNPTPNQKDSNGRQRFNVGYKLDTYRFRAGQEPFFANKDVGPAMLQGMKVLLHFLSPERAMVPASTATLPKAFAFLFYARGVVLGDAIFKTVGR